MFEYALGGTVALTAAMFFWSRHKKAKRAAEDSYVPTPIPMAPFTGVKPTTVQNVRTYYTTSAETPRSSARTYYDSTPTATTPRRRYDDDSGNFAASDVFSTMATFDSFSSSDTSSSSDSFSGGGGDFGGGGSDSSW